MDSVGDQSPYVAVLLHRVKDRSKEILRLLPKPQYARAYCDHLVDTLTNTYLLNIAASKPISESGAEQLLLDSYVLKKGFAELATLATESSATTGGSKSTPLNPAFVKRVNQSTAKLDPLLKTLQVRASPPEGLVQAYLIHIRDRSELNFRKILDLKGITRKGEQHSLIELFNAFKAAPANEGLPGSNPLIAGLQLTSLPSAAGGGGSGGGGGGSASLAAALKESAGAHGSSTPARFDPANFGTALMNAARDAGDRIASPHLGGGLGGSGAVTTTIGSRATSPPPAIPLPSMAGGTGGEGIGDVVATTAAAQGGFWGVWEEG
ncbi:Vacuolar protein sorting-associated protein 53 [Friedmanniomyces endolithicus]|nr:Vacuolar protein sorting-associated protein 53 [Friedmanniomyces endolithicus]